MEHQVALNKAIQDLKNKDLALKEAKAAIRVKDNALKQSTISHQTAESNNQASLKKAAEKQERLQT